MEDTVWGNGYAWNTLGDDGKYYPRLAQVTTKAVFVLWTLWETEYTDALMAVTTHLNDPQRGWFEGRVEATGDVNATLTLSTNAMVLEALFTNTTPGRCSKTASRMTTATLPTARRTNLTRPDAACRANGS